MSNVAQLAALLREEINSIAVPRSLTEDQCASLVAAGLIRETGIEDARPDHRYEATEYAEDVIWQRNA